MIQKFAFTLLFFFAFHSLSAHAVEGRADTRTALPEKVAKDRKEWGTDFDVGTELTRGNVEHNKVESELSVFRNFGGWTAYLKGDLQHSSYRGEKFENRGSGTARLDYHLTDKEVELPKWRIVGFTTYAYNEAVKLNYRNTVGVGPWVDLNFGSVINGISLIPIFSRQQYLGYGKESYWTLSLRYVFSVAITESADIGFDLFYVPRVSDFAQKRIFFSPYIEAFIWERILGLKIKSRTEYEGQPKGGIKTTDTEIVSSLTFHMGE